MKKGEEIKNKLQMLLQDSHRDVKYSTGNIVNDILLTMYIGTISWDHHFVSYIC